MNRRVGRLPMIEVEAGDVVVIPAGVGHCNKGSNGGFSVVGAYPRGQEPYDLRTGEEGKRPDVLENIRKVSLPESDPLFGCLGVNGQNPVRVVAKNPDEPGFVDTGLRLVPPRE